MNLRENWRILLLVVFVVLSSVALFAPSGSGSGAATNGTQAATQSGPTNLKYGLQLSGGTRIRAPLVGYTAEDVAVTADNRDQVERTVAAELGLQQLDVRARPELRAVEIYTENVTKDRYAAALREAGLDVQTDQIRQGVTKPTREAVRRTLDEKISRIGLTGGTVQIATTPNQKFILIEVPNANRTQVLDLVRSRGRVQVVAHFPTEQNGNRTYGDVPLLTQGDFSQIGTAQQGQGDRPPYVRVSLQQESAQNFSNAMQKFGFTSQRGVSNCRYGSSPDDSGYCLYTVVDDRVVYAASMGPDLARSIENGDFEKDPVFIMTATNMSEARNLQINLRAGALPTRLDLNEGTTYYLAPSLASEFKFFSLLTGLVAVLAVSGVVFLRYGSPQVAVPMLVTAMAEVYLLLGFAASVGLALDLSHIAGFIAVIGTGVDDLIIIADEILQEGDVATGRVFQSRFRKAFWVIGAAAATTIIAMSPLAILSLGDLRGFAIVTIVGVLLGVLVTRPAYGDILRNLILED
ncbi:MAG: preprotein translocase subunit SecD [Haloarculaceae archaeon]